jgi:molybdopterin/thiamine biosynthesis adenylyltransferase
MFKSICVIGLGSLGGYLCKHLSEQNINQIIIVDYDLVFAKNISTSVYYSKQSGMKKIDALEEILKLENHNIKVVKIDEEFVEEKTIIPPCDLVIDCRDYVCKRENKIDVRTYISGKHIIIDCRKSVAIIKPYSGAYNIQLTKLEINKAAFLISDLIFQNKFSSMLKNEAVERIDIDLLKNVIKTSIDEEKKKEDLIYESTRRDRKIIRLDQSIMPTIKMNNRTEVKVTLGPITETIFPSYFNEPSDVVKFMGRFVERYGQGKNYILFVDTINNTLELVEETGAA